MGIVLFGIINVLTLGSLGWFWFEFKKLKTQSDHSILQPTIDALQSRLLTLEKDMQLLNEQYEEKLKMVESIAEQLSRALKNQKFMGANFPMTQEESDLKEAMYLGPEKNEIPSVVQFESTKFRLQNEASIDLKTLLKGQLS